MFPFAATVCSRAKSNVQSNDMAMPTNLDFVQGSRFTNSFQNPGIKIYSAVHAKTKQINICYRMQCGRVV